MYRFGVLLFVGIYLASTSALPPCVCTRERRPVCGTDGETYSNKCLLNCARTTNPKLSIEKTASCEGTEDAVCICTYNYSPVCGTDGVTYPNECSLRCEQSLKTGLDIRYKGECRVNIEPLCICTEIYQPICGTDGNTYENPCMLNCKREKNPDLHKLHEGACSNDVKVVDAPERNACACTRNLNPVCASDGNTYNNKCLMHCAGQDLSVVKEAPCEGDQ